MDLRKLYESLEWGDDWEDADMRSVVHYLRGSKSLKLPGSWRDLLFQALQTQVLVGQVGYANNRNEHFLGNERFWSWGHVRASERAGIGVQRASLSVQSGPVRGPRAFFSRVTLFCIRPPRHQIWLSAAPVIHLSVRPLHMSACLRVCPFHVRFSAIPMLACWPMIGPSYLMCRDRLPHHLSLVPI